MVREWRNWACASVSRFFSRSVYTQQSQTRDGLVQIPQGLQPLPPPYFFSRGGYRAIISRRNDGRTSDSKGVGRGREKKKCKLTRAERAKQRAVDGDSRRRKPEDPNGRGRRHGDQTISWVCSQRDRQAMVSGLGGGRRGFSLVSWW